MEAPGGPGGAVRFRPGSEQPGNPAATNPLTLPRGRGTRGAEPTAYMSGFSRKVGIPTYPPPSGAKASWMGDKRTNRWRVQRLHSSSRLSAQRAHSPNPVRPRPLSHSTHLSSLSASPIRLLPAGSPSVTELLGSWNWVRLTSAAPVTNTGKVD